MSQATAEQKKKNFNFNPFVMLFLVIIVVFAATFFVEPGAFDRQVVDGRNQVIPGSFHATARSSLSWFDIFRAVPNGLIGAASIVFLVLIVGGSVEIFNRTGAIPAGVARLVNVSGRGGSAYVLIVLFAVFAVLGGFLGWVEASIPFVPLVVPIVLALGFDSMTAVGVVILGSMVGFAVGPTNVYTIGIAHQVAELQMFSGFGLRFAAYLVFCAVALAYLLVYACRVRKDPSRSLVAGVDVSDLMLDYAAEKDKKLEARHILSLSVLAGTFCVVVYGMTQFKWNINDMSAAFLVAGVLAGFIGQLAPGDLVTALLTGAKGSMGGAMVVGVARGVQWMMDKGNLLDPIINALSGYLAGLPPVGSAVGIVAVVTLLNGIVASGSAKAMALMPIIIPLADLVGVTRQTATFAYQFGDGISNMAWFTYGTLLIFLSYGRVSLAKWYKFLWPLLVILFALSAVFLFIAVEIQYR
ncbi:MAG: AbgT family transporter [Synergistaceae bacterium]|nr:AbgT family transporter [Synergistaceae bacterium]